MAPPQFDRVVIQELAWEIAQVKAGEHPEKWVKDDSDSSMRRTVVAAMNLHGWPADGIPGLIPLILKMLTDKEIEAFSTFNELPCADFELVKANPANWFISGDDANRIRYAIGLDEFTFKGINGGEVLKGRQGRREYEQKLSEKEIRRAKGRYTLDEAATFIHQATGQNAKTILKKITESAKDKTLTTYMPGEEIQQERNYVASWYEAYWDELNDWRKITLPRLVCEFPNPNAPATVQNTGIDEEEAGLTKREKQIRAIEKQTTALGYTPLSIPDGGKKLLMQKCKNEYPKLFGAGDDPFLDAWKEALIQNRIRMKNYKSYSRKKGKNTP